MPLISLQNRCVVKLFATLMFVIAALMVSTPSLAQSEMAQGEVRRIDNRNAKITIRHGEIKTLDMPPMTMVFVAQPKSLIDGIKVGDKIQFLAIEQNNQYVVVKLIKVTE